jgi:hypothetical protein
MLGVESMAKYYDALLIHERELLLAVLRDRMRNEFRLAALSGGEDSINALPNLIHGRRIQRLLETLNPKGPPARRSLCTPSTNHEAATSPSNYLHDTI